MNLKLFLLFISIFYQSNVFAQNINMSLELNPNKTTPLSSLLKLSRTNTQELTIVVEGKDPSMSIGVVYPANYGKEFPVHGLYLDHTNVINVSCGQQKQKITIVTAPIIFTNSRQSNDLMTIQAKMIVDQFPERPSVFNQDLYFTSFPNSHYIVGFDRLGDIRYIFHDIKKQPTIFRMENTDSNIYFLYMDKTHAYVKQDLLGNEIFRRKYSIHHESVPYKNDREIILGNSEWGWEDLVYELNPQKNITKIFSLGDVLRNAASPSDKDLVNRLVYDQKNIYLTNDQPKRIDWAHANSLVYDPRSDILYVSLRHLGVLAINYETWTLRWFLVDDNHRVTTGIKYGTKPADSVYLTDVPSLQKYRMKTKTTEGPRGQHALLIKKNGNILLFDNRSQGNKNPNGSRVVEYSFNESSMRATIVKEFMDSKKSYSRYVGDIDLTGQQNDFWLMFYGNHQPRRIIEWDPEKNQILYQLDIRSQGMMYRVDKYPLYPYRHPNKKYAIDFYE